MSLLSIKKIAKAIKLNGWEGIFFLFFSLMDPVNSLKVGLQLTFLYLEGLDPLVHGPQAHAGGLLGLGHLVHDVAGREGPLTLVQEAPVPGLVRVDPAAVQFRHQVEAGALLPGGQARQLLVCGRWKKNVQMYVQSVRVNHVVTL